MAKKHHPRPNTTTKAKLPLVSVVITCYNYDQFVAEAIESVLSQSYGNIELTVMNDGSTDNSIKVIHKYKDHITIVDRENKGIVRTRNEAIQLAKGKYLCFLDADDYFDKNYIGNMVDIAEQTGADVVYPNWRIFGDRNEKIEFPEFDVQKLIKHEIHCTAESLIRVEAIGDSRFENEVVAEDWDFFLGLALKGKKFVSAKNCYINYRIRQNTRGSSRNYWDDMRYFYEILQKWQKKYPKVVNPIDLPLAVGQKRDEFIDEQKKLIDSLQATVDTLKKETTSQRQSIIDLNNAIKNIQESKTYQLSTKLSAIKHRIKKS